MATAAGEQVVATIDYEEREGERGKSIQVVRTAFDGRDAVDVRLYHRRQDGALMPTRFGLRFPPTLAPQIAAALAGVAQEG
jgi:hypothetical protein